MTYFLNFRFQEEFAVHDNFNISITAFFLRSSLGKLLKWFTIFSVYPTLKVVAKIWNFNSKDRWGASRNFDDGEESLDKHETINLVTKSTEERKGREEHIIRTNKYSVHCAPVKYPMKKKGDGEEQRRNKRSNR